MNIARIKRIGLRCDEDALSTAASYCTILHVPHMILLYCCATHTAKRITKQSPTYGIEFTGSAMIYF
jgi:hypothetical protein